MLKDAREALANLNRVSATVGDPEEQEKLRKTLDDIAQLAERANATAADAQAIVTHIKKRQRHRRRPRDGRGDLRRHPGDGARPEAQPLEVSLARVIRQRRRNGRHLNLLRIHSS